ncbi:BamA/TamA family outer membrane protein [Vibrio sp. E150_011]|uniref:BamA/TamA family outer membrane protein n=1 Tax=Vibrio sp. 10N.261.51.F12 TaxID=3229679 RepID=UPI00354DF433
MASKLKRMSMSALLLGVSPFSWSAEYKDHVDDKKDKVENTRQTSGEKEGFIALPIPMSNPTLGTGVQLLGLYMHAKDPDSVAHNDTSGIMGMYTSTESWLVGAFHDGALNDDTIRYTGGLFHGNLNLKYYGDGNDPTFSDDPLDYGMTMTAVMLRALFKLGDSSWYLGPQYNYMQTEISFNTFNSFWPQPEDVKSGGLGAVLHFDTRDDNYYPTDGWFAQFSYMDYGEQWGGDGDYAIGKLAASNYTSVWENVVIASKVTMESSGGDVPFYEKPTLKMRGFNHGRYRNDNIIQGQFEGRWTFKPRFGLVAFVGLGKTSEAEQDILSQNTIVTKGLGFRWQPVEQKKMNIRLDFAKGPEENTFYLSVGEAF